MNDEKPPLTDALRRLAEQKRRSLTGHPTPQELASYHAGELPPEAEARLREHLAVCRECSDLLLDLAGFADLKPPEGVPELTDDEVEQDWQALRARMGEEKRPADVVPIRPAGIPKPERRYSPLLPIAASLLAVLGFSFGLYQSMQVGSLKQQLEEQRQLWSTTSVSLDNTVHRSGAGEEVESVSSREGALLFLYPDADELYPAYEAEIVGGARVQVVPPKEQDSPVYLVIPRSFLEPGEYEVRLYGVKGGQRDQVGNYQLKVDGP